MASIWPFIQTIYIIEYQVTTVLVQKSDFPNYKCQDNENVQSQQPNRNTKGYTPYPSPFIGKRDE